MLSRVPWALAQISCFSSYRSGLFLSLLLWVNTCTDSPQAAVKCQRDGRQKRRIQKSGEHTMETAVYVSVYVVAYYMRLCIVNYCTPVYRRSAGVELNRTPRRHLTFDLRSFIVCTSHYRALLYAYTRPPTTSMQPSKWMNEWAFDVQLDTTVTHRIYTGASSWWPCRFIIRPTGGGQW